MLSDIKQKRFNRRRRNYSRKNVFMFILGAIMLYVAFEFLIRVDNWVEFMVSLILLMAVSVIAVTAIND